MSCCNTMICTVGTSLLEANLARLPHMPEDQRPDNWEALHKAYEEENAANLVRELLRVDPHQRVCGAEINTIAEARKKEWLDLQNLHFLVSDTDAGKLSGEVLRSFFKKHRELKVKTVEVHVIAQLQDAEPKKFKLHGLRNLVRVAGKIIREMGDPSLIVFDATGGYKAQIAVAVVLGQAMGIKVIYKHDRFNEIIDFPPLPIDFNYRLLGEYADIIVKAERTNCTFEEGEIADLPESLRVLFDEVEVDNQRLYALGPIGQIYLDAWRARHPVPRALTPRAGEPEVKVDRRHHLPEGFVDFMERVVNETEWITRVVCLSYGGQRAIKRTGFHTRIERDELQLIGTYVDRANFGGRFRVFTTDDENPRSLEWAAIDLNQRFGE